MDFLYILQWWAVFLLLGIVFLPITFYMFNRFYDKGYIFSKIIGLVVMSFFLWFLSVINAVPYVSTPIWLMLGIFVLINIVFLWLKRDFFFNLLKTPGFSIKQLLLSVAASEAIFFIAFLLWSFVRGFQPDIYGKDGLEKLMDYGYIMSILRTDYMPPADMWYAGQGINYYYFGHLICATFIRLTGIAPQIGYNLWIATLFGFMAACTFSITSNISMGISKKHAYKAGFISAFMMMFASNLHTFFEGILAPVLRGKGFFEGYWYPNATRYVGYEGSFLPNFTNNDMTIHEFPSYSAIVSDLHAHFINIMLAFTIIALLVAFIMRVSSNFDSYDWRKPPKETPLLIIFLAGAYISNAWDFPIYGMMIGIFVLAVHLKKFGFTWKALYTAVIITVAIASAAFIINIPFHISFSNIAGGIGSGIPYLAITAPDKFFILYGHYLFAAGSLLWVLYMLFIKKALSGKRSQKNKNKQQYASKSGKMKRFAETVKIITDKINASDLIACCLFLGGAILIFLPEIIYIRDIYESGYPRSNTMFKLTYQACIMFMLTMGYIYVRVKNYMAETRKIRWVSVCLTLAVALPLLYPLPKPFGGGSVNGYYNITTGGRYKGIDGLKNAYSVVNVTGERYPGDYAAAMWLLENLSGQPVILEASRSHNSYTGDARISALTGFPTIVGWYTHEQLWRGNIIELGERLGHVSAIYVSDDIEETMRLLKQYSVEYIILGEIERNAFGNINTEKIYSLGEIVFVSNNYPIYDSEGNIERLVHGTTIIKLHDVNYNTTI